MSGDFLEGIANSRNIGDIFSRLKQTTYSSYLGNPLRINEGLGKCFDDLFNKVTGGIKHKKAFVGFFYDRKLFLRNVPKYIKGIRDKRLKDILLSYVDMINITSIVRYRIIRGLKVDMFARLLIPYGHLYKQVRESVSARSLSELKENLGNLVPDFLDFTDLRKSLYHYHYQFLERAWYGYPFSLSVPFSLLRMKELEIKNIGTCIEGVRFNVKPGEIKRMMVGIDAVSREAA